MATGPTQSRSWEVTAIDIYHAHHYACKERHLVVDHRNGDRRFYAKGHAEEQRMCARCKIPLNHTTPLHSIERNWLRAPQATPAPVRSEQTASDGQRHIQGRLSL